MTISHWISSHPAPTGKDAQLQAAESRFLSTPPESPAYDAILADLDRCHSHAEPEPPDHLEPRLFPVGGPRPYRHAPGYTIQYYLRGDRYCAAVNGTMLPGTYGEAECINETELWIEDRIAQRRDEDPERHDGGW